MEEHFFNGYGDLSYWSLFYIGVICVGLTFAGENQYEKWLCGNYEQVTGFQTKYINFDSCYIKGGDGVFIRYDDKYKSVN